MTHLDAALALVGAFGRHGGGGGGFGHLASTMAHAAVWSVIGRLIWHAPGWLLVVAFAAAAWYLLRARPGRRDGQWRPSDNRGGDRG